jgi:N-hydroxyarylamine O-acetyltransferase
MESFKIQSYLKRIKVLTNIQVDLSTLFILQKNHLLNVPFENLDIHNGKEIKLNPDLLYQKVVMNKRGGFCYELNGLLYHLLKEIGFEVKLISGRVYQKDANYGPEFDHLAIIATINGDHYLVDVGFGKFSLEPLLLKMNCILEDQFGQFEFDRYDTEYFRINQRTNGLLNPLYIFKDLARNLEDFEDMCHYHQRSAESSFTKNKVISIVTSNGRITLTESQVKVTTEAVEKVLVHDPNQFDHMLNQYFNIKI